MNHIGHLATRDKSYSNGKACKSLELRLYQVNYTQFERGFLLLKVSRPRKADRQRIMTDVRGPPGLDVITNPSLNRLPW